ncbi:MAG: subtilase [Bdellovibrionales bacterium RIFCSPHIGHO2_01_FULL_40_29]|nr:MAG: subtilase [Bdellovibrionales bacterium RIFCSPHIGHO2_01_FULL_40_29]OFZ34660.1 MAG: subtilase [Bdellovibrionales bacterium RIFCSPHIGHO2_02_FULL_40_15]
MHLKERVTQVAIILTFILPSLSFAKPVESVPGEYVVRLKPGISMSSNKILSQALGAYVKSTIPSQNIVVVKRPVFEIEKSAVKALAVNDIVEVVEPNYIYRASKTPNDPLYGQLWGLSNKGQADSEGTLGTAGVDIDVEKAWDIETGNKKKIIAVIDTGVDFTHPDLIENLWTNEVEAAGVEGVDDDNNGVIDDIHGYNAITNSGNASDDHGHGSHCAGTIGAKGDDAKGIVGVNWDTQIMAVKFLDGAGSGSLEDAIKAIDYATKMGAHVLSNSWGGGGLSQTLLEAIQRSHAAGTIFIAAAGNDSNNNDTTDTFPANYAVENIISVAAINNVGGKASFSNYGKRTVHMGAPGVNIYSSTGGNYDSWSGTSMATPHVSGVAGLVWAHEPELTALELKARLIATVTPVAGLRGKTRTGGIVNAYNALTNTVAPPDPNDPLNWATQPYELASASPYAKDTNETFEVKVNGAAEVAVYFEKFDTESNYDTVQIIDAAGNVVQTLSGTNDDVFSASVAGDTLKIIFKSDGSVEKSGWKITKVAFR